MDGKLNGCMDGWMEKRMERWMMDGIKKLFIVILYFLN